MAAASPGASVATFAMTSPHTGCWSCWPSTPSAATSPRPPSCLRPPSPHRPTVRDFVLHTPATATTAFDSDYEYSHGAGSAYRAEPAPAARFLPADRIAPGWPGRSSRIAAVVDLSCSRPRWPISAVLSSSDLEATGASSPSIPTDQSRVRSLPEATDQSTCPVSMPRPCPCLCPTCPVSRRRNQGGPREDC
jgi:hypothetical protein